MNKFYLLFILSLACLSPGCVFNPTIDGAHVISDNDANARFSRILQAKLLTEFPINSSPEVYSAFFNDNLDSDVFPISTCFRNIYYYVDSVEYCERALLNVHADTPENLLVLFGVTKAVVCKLDRAVMFTERHPLEGEMHICSAVGSKNER